MNVSPIPISVTQAQLTTRTGVARLSSYPVDVHPDHTGSSPYSDAQIDTKYEHDPGLYQAPVAGPPGTAPELIRVHAGSYAKVSSWTAERMNDPPKLPDPAPFSSNERLGFFTIIVAAPFMRPDGMRGYRRSGVYLHYLLAAPSVYETGRPQYDLRTAILNAVGPGDFDPNILH